MKQCFEQFFVCSFFLKALKLRRTKIWIQLMILTCFLHMRKCCKYSFKNPLGRIIKAFDKICFNTPFMITPSGSGCLPSCCLSLEPSLMPLLRGLFQAAAFPFLPLPFRRGALGTCGSAGCSHCPRVTHQPEGPGARPGGAPLLWLPAASRSACKCDL